MGYVGGCKHNFRKAFTYALSWLFEIWKISITVKIDAIVDALWICISLLCNINLLCGVIYHILREASVLLVLQ